MTKRMVSSITMESREEMLREFLKKDWAWNWEGKKRGTKGVPTTINYGVIDSTYQNYLEWYIQEAIMMPAIWRSMVLFKAIKSGGPFKDLDYAESHFGTVLSDGEEHVVITCDDCAEMMQMQLSSSEWKGRNRYAFMDWIIWEHPEYQYRTVTKEEIDALGVTTPEFEHQTSMF